MTTSIQRVNNNSFMIHFADNIQAHLPSKIQVIQTSLYRVFGEAIQDTIPAYASLLLILDEGVSRQENEVIQRITECIHSVESHTSASQVGELIEIPVYYSLNTGPDLKTISQIKSISIENIIKLHSEGIYQVYAVGFSPAFAYLGTLDDRIAAPRLETPRLRVPLGSVGIAENQTGVYPMDSPGGWNIIGRTPQAMMEWVEGACHALLKVGDHVRFKPIDEETFIEQSGSAHERVKDG